MLVAKRDPFELGAHDHRVPHAGTAPTGSRFARALNVLQMLGALLAVPVGIGSAYTMYRANFSPEASCQSLRANIVAMLDRSVDASTRHMLVRRDVEAFERTCGTVDPDATAAFKVLLAADKAPPPVIAVPAPRAEPQPAQIVARKIEPAPVVKAEPAPAAKVKPLAPRAPVVATAAVQPEASVSDAAWVAAVRSALVTHERDAVPAATPALAAPTSLAPPARTLGEWRTSPELPAPPLAAPALPPPAAVATVAVPQVDPDHPVPPAAIPEAAPQDAARPHSRFGELVGEIPFVGKTLADHVSR